MTLRDAGYRVVCALLGLYAVAAVAGMSRWSGGGLFASGALIFYTSAHAFLLAMASLRASRPAVTGSIGALLLTFALVLVVVSGATVTLGPPWLPTGRLAAVSLAYIGVRLCAPRAARPDDRTESD